MATSSNKTNQELGADSFQPVMNETYPQQTYASAPPPYQAVAGPSPIAPQGVQSQSYGVNYYPPMSNQPPPMMNYGYTHMQPATGQSTFPGSGSPYPNAVPVSHAPELAAQPVNPPDRKSSSSKCWWFGIAFVILVILRALTRSAQSFNSYSYSYNTGN